MIADTVRKMDIGTEIRGVPKRTAAAMVREANRIAKRDRSALLLTRMQDYHRAPTCTVERVA